VESNTNGRGDIRIKCFVAKYELKKISIFGNITPCIPRKLGRHFGGKALDSTRFILVSCLVHFSTLKMEAKISYGTSVDFQWTTQRYVPEDRTHYNSSCDNLKSCVNAGVWSEDIGVKVKLSL
jgi:hypothetical protein